MERRRGKIAGLISAALAVILSLFGCSMGGTETGNPELPEAMIANEMGTALYSNDKYGIELTFPRNWYYNDDFDNGTANVTFTDGRSPESTIDIYIINLPEQFGGLGEYLAAVRPGEGFEEYSNKYTDGYILKDGGTKEIYFLEGSTLLYIIANLSEGSGSNEAEIILSSVRIMQVVNAGEAE